MKPDLLIIGAGVLGFSTFLVGLYSNGMTQFALMATGGMMLALVSLKTT